MSKFKKIYFIHTYTGTALARFIRFYTKEPYSHISISLDDTLNNMYSFGRLNPYVPFIGGFVIEGKNKGTFKRFIKTEAIIFSYVIKEEQYERLKKDLENFKVNRKIYKFNILGLFLILFNRKIKRKNYFYCAEFVKYIMEKDNIITGLPSIVKPNDFINLKNMELIYKGKLQNYSKVQI